jgi:hypothetical protein
MWSKFYLYRSWAKLYCWTKETPSWTKWVTRVRMKKRHPLRQVTCPITICKQVQRVLLHTPEEWGGLFWRGTQSNLAPRMANTDKHLAMSVREGGRPKNWEMRLVLVTSSCYRSWIILSDYQIASQSNRHKGHLKREPFLDACPPVSLLVLPSSVTTINAVHHVFTAISAGCYVINVMLCSITGQQTDHILYQA